MELKAILKLLQMCILTFILLNNLPVALCSVHFISVIKQLYNMTSTLYFYGLP